MAKRFFYTLLIFLLLNSISKLYSQENKNDWKQIDSLMNLGLVESALPEIESGLIKAKQAQDVENHLKAVLLKMDVLQQKGAEINQLTEFLNAEIADSYFPAKSILHSLLAETCQNYYYQYRWEINNRTNLENENTNIEYWTSENFKDNIKKNYLLSIQNADLLYSISGEKIQGIIEGNFLSKKNNGSIYEILAKRAINYFTQLDVKSKDQDNDKIVELLRPYNSFINLEFDSDSGSSIAFNIYKSLLKLHHNSSNFQALIRTDLERIKLVRSLFLNDNFELNYINTLKDLIALYPAHQAIAEVYYEIARIHCNRGLRYDPVTYGSFKWEYQKAVEICQFVMNKFPNSEGASLCELMLEKIETPFVGISMKSVQLPQTPILASLSFQNCSNVYFKLIKLNYDEAQKVINFSRNISYLEPYLKEIPYKVWQERLPKIEDYQRYHAQIRIPELDYGFYVLLSSNSPGFDNESQIHLNAFTVSELSLISRPDGVKGKDYFVLNRRTGHPLKDVRLSLFKEQFDRPNDQYIQLLERSFISDKYGFIHIDKPESNINQQILTYKNDTLFEGYTYFRSFNQNKEKVLYTQFFTDRKLYRPGQIVYYKGIISKVQGKKHSSVQDKLIKIEFYDVNNELIKSENHTSNQYGSFHGSFIIPKNTLKGQMQIRNEYGRHFIQVEEYKRPDFEIKFDTLKSQYRINDSIHISGLAQSFSGIPIGNATLKYKILKTNFFFGILGMVPQGQAKQIAFGKLETMEDGTFKIEFFASAAHDLSHLKNQVFQYQVEVEVTDINGETQSDFLIIPVSNINLVLNSLSSEAIDKQKSSGIPISAKNLSGEKQDVNVSVSIFKLNTPDRAFKKRVWEKPDVFLTDQETFYTYFSNSQFANELNKENWMISEQIYQAEINTGEQSEVEIFDFPYWEDGEYKIILKAKDSFDEEVEKITYFTLFDSKSSILPYDKMDWTVLEKNEYEVGDTCVIYLGSSANQVSVLFEIQQKNKILKSDRFVMEHSQVQLKIPITERHIGDIRIDLVFIKDNEIYYHSKKFKVIAPREQISIHLNTFRSILHPNEKEMWEVQIKSPKGIVQSELAAAMTDFSIEKILPYRWNFSLPGRYYYGINWVSGRFNLSFARSFGKFAYRYFGDITNPIPSFYKVKKEHDGVLKIRGNASVLVENELADEIPVFSVAQDVGISSPDIMLRKNFNETAFFYPNLRTDPKGIIKLKFTAPESLSKWKVKLLAHTKDLKSAYVEKEVITQKELMLTPNLPRFVREGDTLFFSTKISNLTEESIAGKVKIQLFDGISDQALYSVLVHKNPSQDFEVQANSSVNRRWMVRIPEYINVIKYRLVASSENHSDGEERFIPVLSNRILVTESLPLYVNARESKEVLFKNLINSGTDSILQHHQLKFEFTSNPMWYAILALPYIADDHQENSIGLFSKFYANSMASYLLNSSPEIEEVLKQLKTNNTQALESALSKNEDLKSILLQETPWLLDAKSESEQKQRLALFFDRNTIDVNLEQDLKKLLSLQLADGSWTWYKGGRGSQYITRSIVSGLIKLEYQSIINKSQKPILNKSIESALYFLKRGIVRDYKALKERQKDYLDKDYLGASEIQFLYILSHFSQEENEAELDLAISYYLNQAQRFRMNKSNYLQAMIAIILHRKADDETAKLITQSLIERSSLDDEMGRFWNTENSFYWYQRPIDAQSLIIQAFNEIGVDKKNVNQLKRYLLKQKQTQLWETPKASVEAVNALLSGSSKALSTKVLVQVRLGGRPVDFSQSEDGSGFVEKRWNANVINSNMGRIQLKNTNSSIGWGAMHWQYLQDIDKIESASTGLKIEKQLYLKVTDENGEHLVPIGDSNSIHLGDRIVSRILISADRDFDFVHLKDQRAATFEPTQIFSSHQYQDGLSYYASTTDVATHYYFDSLNKGNYVIEIETIASQLGSFSNGISTIQCLYAPEFNAHTKGEKVVVK